MRGRNFLIYLLMAFVPAVTVVTASYPVLAQEKRSFLDKLFGRKKAAVEEQKTQPGKSRKAKSSAQNKNQLRSGKNNTVMAKNSAARPQIEKSPQAKRILIIGDFIAAHVADGLNALYADNPDLLVIKQTEAASGLVRDDYYSWPIKIKDIIGEQKPDMVIAALGSNDRQSLRFEGQFIDYGSEIWATHYRDRIRRLTGSLTQETQENEEASSQKIWAWLGLPPFQKAQLNANALVLNAYFEEEAKKAGGHFIDIWRGFVDDQGGFNFSGHDAAGQLARLRTADGINFTASGRAKLAFYANEAVQIMLAGQVEADPILAIIEKEMLEALISQSDTDSVLQPEKPKNIQYLPPQSLFEVSEELLELVGNPPDVISISSRTPSLQPGRADYFLYEDF